LQCGLSGNPAGRSKGSRNRLGEAFLTDLHAEWERSGAEALRKCATDDPTAFCKLVGNLLPKEIDSTLKVDIDLFQSCKNFHDAWLLAQETIGAGYTVTFPRSLSFTSEDEWTATLAGYAVLLTFTDDHGIVAGAILSTYADIGNDPDVNYYGATGTITETPLPTALPLFATGLVGLGLLGWRKKRKTT
jgi:hypothetical protein